LASGLFYVSTAFLTHIHINYWVRVPAFAAVFAGGPIYLAERAGKIAAKTGVVAICLLAVQGMGTLTYCLYVFHPEIMTVNASPVSPLQPLHVGLTHLPTVALKLLAVACFFYFAVEKPFDLKKRVSGTGLVDAP
jgi:peptidoglycan/LPS O-acetylase OafA/YrhL